MRIKRLVALATILFFLVAFAGCGNTKVIGGYEYDTYGVFDANEKKNPDIDYEVIWGNVIWGVILFETVIAPIYFFGFSLFEPVGKKDQSRPKGAVI